MKTKLLLWHFQVIRPMRYLDVQGISVGLKLHLIGGNTTRGSVKGHRRFPTGTKEARGVGQLLYF